MEYVEVSKDTFLELIRSLHVDHFRLGIEATLDSTEGHFVKLKTKFPYDRADWPFIEKLFQDQLSRSAEVKITRASLLVGAAEVELRDCVTNFPLTYIPEIGQTPVRTVRGTIDTSHVSPQHLTTLQRIALDGYFGDAMLMDYKKEWPSDSNAPSRLAVTLVVSGALSSGQQG